MEILYMTIKIDYTPPGRGAWTSVGGMRHWDGTRVGNQYRSTTNKTLGPIGADVYLKSISSTIDTVHINEYAVWRGAFEIQSELRRRGFYNMVVDGVWGPGTDAALKAWQTAVGTDFSGKPMIIDGIYGQQTARTMWQPRLLQAFQNKANGFQFLPNADNIALLNDYAKATVMLESGWDIAAVGYTTPLDNGLCQINTKAHGISSDEAFRPDYAFNFKANFVLDNFAYSLGDLEIAIVSYNVGQGGAYDWDRNGRPLTWAAADYLRAIKPLVSHPKLVKALERF
jgi:hypothetical protein